MRDEIVCRPTFGMKLLTSNVCASRDYRACACNCHIVYCASMDVECVYASESFWVPLPHCSVVWRWQDPLLSAFVEDSKFWHPICMTAKLAAYPLHSCVDDFNDSIASAGVEFIHANRKTRNPIFVRPRRNRFFLSENGPIVSHNGLVKLLQASDSSTQLKRWALYDNSMYEVFPFVRQTTLLCFHHMPPKKVRREYFLCKEHLPILLKIKK